MRIRIEKGRRNREYKEREGEREKRGVGEKKAIIFFYLNNIKMRKKKIVVKK